MYYKSCIPQVCCLNTAILVRQTSEIHRYVRARMSVVMLDGRYRDSYHYGIAFPALAERYFRDAHSHLEYSDNTGLVGASRIIWTATRSLAECLISRSRNYDIRPWKPLQLYRAIFSRRYIEKRPGTPQLWSES